MMVPVVWNYGPAYCGYCENHRSVSFQALYKHMRDYHRKEVESFDSTMMPNIHRIYEVKEKEGDEFKLEDKVPLKVEMRNGIYVCPHAEMKILEQNDNSLAIAGGQKRKSHDDERPGESSYELDQVKKRK